LDKEDNTRRPARVKNLGKEREMRKRDRMDERIKEQCGWYP
jgi:hypothetical protein